MLLLHLLYEPGGLISILAIFLADAREIYGFVNNYFFFNYLIDLYQEFYIFACFQTIAIENDGNLNK